MFTIVSLLVETGIGSTANIMMDRDEYSVSFFNHELVVIAAWTAILGFIIFLLSLINEK